MSRSLGPEQPLGAAETEGAFREQLLRAVARWQHQLGAEGPSPSWADAIAREAGRLRAAAQSHGWAAAKHVAYLENIAYNARPALPQALCVVADALRVPQGPAPVTLRIDEQAGQPGVTPVTDWPPPVASAPPPVSPSSVWPIAPPPLIGGLAAVQERAAPPDATLRSRGPGGGATRPEAPPAPAAVRLPSGVPNVLPPDSLPRPRAPPSLLARSMLGLRAFRRKEAPGHSPPPGGGEPHRGGGLLGFRRLPSDPGPRVPGHPPLGLPELSTPRRASRPPRSGDAPRRSDPAQGPSAIIRPRGPASGAEAPAPRWFYVLTGIVGLLGIATVTAIVAVGRRPLAVEIPKQAPDGGAPRIVSFPSPTVSNPLPMPPPPEDVHRRGAETPELRALLDEQAKLASHCRIDPASCPRGWTSFARDAQTPIAIDKLVQSRSEEPLGAWLRQLKIPSEMSVHDEQSLRASFDYKALNRTGHAETQAKLFQCAAYAEIFESALIKYDAPPWLMAVVYQESGCNPRATSPVGAKGLWQFMPESARAYGLRVVEGDVDERLNPIKSTDAAIHFLTDLQRDLGAWDLTLAGYNMGPYAVLTRLSQLARIGVSAGFWDLVRTHALPEETASYVPAIEAYALVLQNASVLKFSLGGKRLESTAEIVVKPGTRLSLIAKCAATTTIHIRELNPEFLRDVVPEGESTVRVPDAEQHRAQGLLEQWTPDQNEDTCVGEDFDWGAKQFTGCPQSAAPR